MQGGRHIRTLQYTSLSALHFTFFKWLNKGPFLPRNTVLPSRKIKLFSQTVHDAQYALTSLHYLHSSFDLGRRY